MTINATGRRSDSDKHGIGPAHRPRKAGIKIETTVFDVVLYEPIEIRFQKSGSCHAEAPNSLKRLYQRI
jgi:hypothetical protein